jgi:uncharacterized protein
MIIGVISDTHGMKVAIRQAVSAAGAVDMWLHAGDFRRDADYLQKLTNLPVVAVEGNCDNWGRSAQEELIEVAGKKIWMTHGHRYQVKQSMVALVRKSEELQADVAIFGHTHLPFVLKEQGILLFNPGSAAYSSTGRLPTYGILTINGDGKIAAEIHEII